MITQQVYVPMGIIYSKSGCLYGLHLAELQLTFDDIAYPFSMANPATSGQPCELHAIQSGLLTNAWLIRTINIPFNVAGAAGIRKKGDVEAVAWAKCTPEQKALADMLNCRARFESGTLQYSCRINQKHTTYIYNDATQRLEPHAELGLEACYPLFSPVVSLLCSVGYKEPEQLFMKYPAFVLLQNDTVVPFTAQIDPTLYALYRRYVTDARWFGSNELKLMLGSVMPQWDNIWSEFKMPSNSAVIAKRYMNTPFEASLQDLLGQQDVSYTTRNIAEPALLSAKAEASVALTIQNQGQHTLREGTIAVKVASEAMTPNTFVKLASDTRYLILNEGEEGCSVTSVFVTKQTCTLPAVQCARTGASQLYGLIASCYTATNAQIAAYLKMLDEKETTLVRWIVCKPEYSSGVATYITNAKCMEVHMGEQPADAVVLREAESFVYSFGVTRKQFQVKLQGNAAVKRSTSIYRMRASLSLYLPQEMKNGMQLQVDMREVTKGVTMLSFVDALSHVASLYTPDSLVQIEQQAIEQGFLFSPSVKNTSNLAASLLPDMVNAVVHLGGSTFIELCSSLNLSIMTTKTLKRLYLKAPQRSSGITKVHIYADVQTLYIVESDQPVEYYIHGNIERIIPILAKRSNGLKRPLQVHVKAQMVTKLMNSMLTAINSDAPMQTVTVNGGSAWQDAAALYYSNIHGAKYSVPVLFGKHIVLYGTASWIQNRQAEKYSVDCRTNTINFIADVL